MPHKILIVEDESHTQEVFKYKANKEDLEFSYASNGEEALQKARNEGSFEVVLLDIRMPGKDGFYFLEEKIKDAKLKDLPVIVFTNISTKEWISKAMALGVKGYLIKANHTLESILNEINKCIRKEPCTFDMQV